MISLNNSKTQPSLVLHMIIDIPSNLLIGNLYLLSFCFESLGVLERGGCIFTFDLVSILMGPRDDLVSCALMEMMVVFTLMIFLQLSNCLFEQCQIFLLFIVLIHYCWLWLLLRGSDEHLRAGVFSRLKEELDAWLLRLGCSLAWLRC